MDLISGKQRLIIPFSEAAKVPNAHSMWEPSAKHWFNHLLYSPDGQRFIFLHRWRGPAQGQASGHACSRRMQKGRTCT
jgi:hypothetical protein